MSINTTDLSKLREEIERLSRENANLKREGNKFGLGYKTYPEEGDAQRILNNEIPFLNFNPEFSTLKSDKTESDIPHVLIEGDNLPSLMTLQATHRGKVDVIYIDPPYNTGNKDFIYNDSFVSDDDGFRHSKWLSFMKPRLVLAKELLSETGVIFVSIDDNEQAPLKMLMDEVFGGKNFVANLVWQGGRKNNARYISTGHDYTLVYFKNSNSVKEEGKLWREKKFGIEEVKRVSQRIWKETGGDKELSRRKMKEWYRSLTADDRTRELSRYSFFNSDGSLCRDDNITAPNGKGGRYIVLHPVTKKPVPTPPRGWIWGEGKMKRMIENDEVIFGEDHTKPISAKRHLDMTEGNVLMSVFERQRTHSKRELQSVLGENAFSFPKDTEVIKKWIKVAGEKDSIILDFFAGSGTTGHAVVELNKEDGGNRQCILVTHGEEKGKNIAQAVTAERMRRVLTGENWADGKEHDSLPGELYYYQLDYREDQDSMSGRDFVSAVALAENAHAIVEQDVDDSVVILDGKEHLVGVWTDYRLLDPYYEDELEDGTAMSEYRIQRMNEWAESQEKRIVWYVDTDPIFSETISHEDLLEEGKMCSGVSLLRDPYTNKVTNVMNRLKNVLVKIEEEDTGDY